MSAERLQKVLARAGVGSRRKIEELIKEGRITVNGQPAELGQRADLAEDAVKVDGRRILPSPAAKRYVLLNKPRACVSTVSDPEDRRTVLDLVPPRLRHGLNPVGRLDYDTEGLLILTDDGELAHRITHPSFGCTKTYEVKVRGRPAEAALARLRSGLVIDGRRVTFRSIEPRTAARGPGPGPAVAAGRVSVKNSWWTVVLGEGRTRQIREMFFRVGHPVQRLRRVAIGPLRDPKLPLGGWRMLDEHEVALFERRFGGQPGQPARAKKPTRPRGAAAHKKAPRGRVAPGRAPKDRKRTPSGKR